MALGTTPNFEDVAIGSDIPGLGSRYLRVDVNLQEHMDRFVNALIDIQGH